MDDVDTMKLKMSITVPYHEENVTPDNKSKLGLDINRRCPSITRQTAWSTTMMNAI